MLESVNVKIFVDDIKFKNVVVVMIIAFLFFFVR